ncbi:hypothetical protein W97_08113 [Coniosporium apollinis CBS 100218]|uniref:MSP domain-containing protein n=1 Tax=Coniosporium apollinis (strain CBS 100218) TaxID=1168221 RepID=R7Z3S8_CONA1|nr:uncharacterized protein W97_08113 [Coniosporium apollinis CBS 100218]EON68855.1 hypothetical protein W97_08113 [Coniosporium apollinis CBS 100218]
MSVELEPVELGFKRPFSHEVSQVLRLKNPNSDPVAFKVKTTAPKQYCVRPNSGRIEPGGDVEVQVLLQAMKEDPPMDARCRDKFLVQSVAVTADKDFSNVASIWAYYEKDAKQQIQEKKIRVVFLPPDGANVATPASRSVNGMSMHDAASSHRSPSPETFTPQRGSSEAPVGPVSAHNPASSGQSYISAAASNVTSAIPTSGEDLKQQLEQAKAEIARLTQSAQESVLRQRKSDAINQDTKERITTGSTGMGTQQVAASGVPVQVVAGLCLLCFLLAYFLF